MLARLRCLDIDHIGTISTVNDLHVKLCSEHVVGLATGEHWWFNDLYINRCSAFLNLVAVHVSRLQL